MAQSHREAARRLFEIAEQQQGFFTTKQAKAAGFAENTHPYHVQVGNWIREYRGIYRLALFPAADRPDLVLIDGGAGQLSVAREVLAELGLHDICLVGVAKGPDRDAGREHFYVAGASTPFMLEPRDPVLYFVQRLRDEAHRFAIGTHRAKRAKSLGANPLDEIAGIGPTRKRALLKHFGSAKAVSRAGVDDLQAVEGISAEMARKIYDFFHERRV